MVGASRETQPSGNDGTWVSSGWERCFQEVLRRRRVIGRFPTEMVTFSLVWTVRDQDASQWRGLVRDADPRRRAQRAAVARADQRPGARETVGGRNRRQGNHRWTTAANPMTPLWGPDLK